MSKKQDWTPRPKILGWVVVNLFHPMDGAETPAFRPGRSAASVLGVLYALLRHRSLI